MKAAILKENKFILSEVEKPVLQENEKGAIVKVIGCGLCGSDIVKYKQKLVKDGAVLGHEIIGEIIEINTCTNFKAGDKIVMGHHYPCFNCVYCRGENYSMCKTFKESNIIPGGFAEFIKIDENHLRKTVFHVSENLDDTESSFLEPLACCIRAVKRAELKENSKVLVIGLGSIGFLMGQAIKAFGHYVIGSDLKEDRLKLAFEHNFDNVIRFESIENTSDYIKKIVQEEGVDAVFLTSGATSTLNFATSVVRNGGTIIIFASLPSEAGFTNNNIYYRELKIIGSYSPSPDDLKKSSELLKEKKVVVKNVSTEYNIKDLQKAVNDTLEQKIFKAYIKL